MLVEILLSHQLLTGKTSGSHEWMSEWVNWCAIYAIVKWNVKIEITCKDPLSLWGWGRNKSKGEDKHTGRHIERYTEGEKKILWARGLNFTRLVSMSLGNSGKWLKHTTSLRLHGDEGRERKRERNRERERERDYECCEIEGHCWVCLSQAPPVSLSMDTRLLHILESTLLHLPFLSPK